MSGGHENVGNGVESLHLGVGPESQSGGKVDDPSALDFVEGRYHYDDSFCTESHGKFNGVVEHHGMKYSEAIIRIAYSNQGDRHCSQRYATLGISPVAYCFTGFGAFVPVFSPSIRLASSLTAVVPVPHEFVEIMRGSRCPPKRSVEIPLWASFPTNRTNALSRVNPGLISNTDE